MARSDSRKFPARPASAAQAIASPVRDMNAYSLLDSGNGRKLEQFGPYRIDRPAAAAVWRPRRPETDWRDADAVFSRVEGKGWSRARAVPETWITTVSGLSFHVGLTDFGHVGVFPEHSHIWNWLEALVSSRRARDQAATPYVLNLFAYSGGATLAAARAGSKVCHVDASRATMVRARENAALNGAAREAVRWITDDVRKFLGREDRRGQRYDIIVLDPPSFGRGTRQEVFKIERDLPPLLGMCRGLLTERPLGLALTCHTPGFTPLLLSGLLHEAMDGIAGDNEAGELVLPGAREALPLPSGAYATWATRECVEKAK